MKKAYFLVQPAILELLAIRSGALRVSDIHAPLFTTGKWTHPEDDSMCVVTDLRYSRSVIGEALHSLWRRKLVGQTSAPALYLSGFRGVRALLPGRPATYWCSITYPEAVIYKRPRKRAFS